MTTEVVEQERLKKKEVTAGAGALIILLLIAFAFGKKKKEEPPGGEGVVTPSVEIATITPVMSPGEYGGSVSAGTSIKLQTSIRNKSTKNGVNVSIPVTVKFMVYEGSIWVTHGTLLRTLTVTASLPAGASTTITSPSFATVVGTIDRRDVGVEVWYEGKKIVSREWDDVYYVKQPVTAAAVEVLSIAWL